MNNPIFIACDNEDKLLGHFFQSCHDIIREAAVEKGFDYESSYYIVGALVVPSSQHTGRGGATGDNVQVIEQMGVVADLFNSIIAMVLVLGANAISRRVSSTSLF